MARMAPTAATRKVRNRSGASRFRMKYRRPNTGISTPRLRPTTLFSHHKRDGGDSCLLLVARGVELGQDTGEIAGEHLGNVESETRERVAFDHALLIGFDPRVGAAARAEPVDGSI